MDYRKDIDENVRSGLVELLILQLLCDEDMYGYQIRQELATRTEQAFLIREGSLYGPLYRMSQRGLISDRRVLVGEKRFRNYYHIEEAGRAYLAYGKEQIDLVFHGVNALFQTAKHNGDTKWVIKRSLKNT